MTVPVRQLKNVGPQRALLLEKMGLRTVEDLLIYYPKRYEDRSVIRKIGRVQAGESVTIVGSIRKIQEQKTGKKILITKAWVEDETGKIPALWFNQPFVKRQLCQGRQVMIYGKVDDKYLSPQLMVEDYEVGEKDGVLPDGRIIPVYGTTDKMPQKILRKIIYDAVMQYAAETEETLPEELRKRHHLMEKSAALWQMHFPDTMIEQKAARYRLAFEELYLFQLAVLAGRQPEKKADIGRQPDGDDQILGNFTALLPFPLTKAQKRVIREIYRDMDAPFPMSRLVQGDVGSGKTLVAAAALYKAAVSGYQGAMMVPTEILAHQHDESLRPLFSKLGMRICCLTGSTPAKEREAIEEEIRRGEMDVVVGTHALIQEGMVFKSLGLAVTDEQHRFGVVQRAELRAKGSLTHMLVMTATPIPRSLALTLYGDLDLSVIDELPPGRKNIKTYAVGYEMESRIIGFLKKEIEQGRQVYIVCPLVEESEAMDLQSAARLAEHFAEEDFCGFRVALLHGKMKGEEKDAVMEGFQLGRIHVLVATTVVEVGINIPNATVMVVRDAERFGLAQLHQLRGRVGRGEHQSYCILMHRAKSPDALKRMKIMETTQDGFKIAEADLSIRGPGDFFGTRQHGLPELKVADLVLDGDILEIARQEALCCLSSGQK